MNKYCNCLYNKYKLRKPARLIDYVLAKITS